MFSVRALPLIALPAALALVSQASAAPVEASSVIVRRVYFTPATPLDQIPLYSLDAAAPGAMTGLENEIDRLYRHATTLPSGADRRSFETRIYLLEKQLSPLLKEFNAAAWEKLRDAVKTEWLAVQASLPESAAPVVDKSQKPAVGGAPLAAAR